MNNETAKKLQRLVADSYNKIAVDFDISRQKEIWPEIRVLAGSVKPGAKVLDVGCGNGRLLEVLLDKSVDYLGIDSSSSLIALAKNNYPQFVFQINDILDLSKLPNDYYDEIFCLAVILHLPGRVLRVQALKNLAAKLKPGGRLIISVWDLCGYKKFGSLLRKVNWKKFIGRQNSDYKDLDYGDLIFPWKNTQGQEISDRYYHAFRRGELVRLLAQTSLKITDFYKKEGNYWLIAIK